MNRTLFAFALLATTLSATALTSAGCGGRQATTAGDPDAVAPTGDRDGAARLNDNTTDFVVNGIRVIVKQDSTTPLVTASIYFDGGVALHDAEEAGLDRFALNVATDGGPEGMTRSEYRNALDRVGASIGASTDRDYASATLFSLGSELNDAFALFARTLRQPALADGQLELTRQQMIASVRSLYDDADSAVRETVQQFAWANHPYVTRPQGEEVTLQRFTRRDLTFALNRLLTRERMLVVFVGDIKPLQAAALVEQHLADLPGSSSWHASTNGTIFPDNVPPFAWQRGNVEVLVRPELPTNYIIGYFAAPSPDHEDYPAMLLATQILRNRLFEEVRTRRNLTYAVSSGLGTRRANVGFLYVTATDPATTLGVMYNTIDAMITTPVSRQDLENQLRIYLTRYYMSLQSTGAQASMLAQWELLGGGRANADAFIDAMRRVTPNDVARVLNTYVRNVQYGVVGDPELIPEQTFTAR